MEAMKNVFALILLTLLWSGVGVAKDVPDTLSPVSMSDGSPQCELPKENAIQIDKTLVRYVEAGEGSVVVLIHGNAGSVDDFDFKSLGQLCRNHRVIAVDRPGHGKSERPDGAASLRYQTRFLHQTLLRLGVIRPVLVGHSWGGSLALAYAVAFPGELSGIVLLAPAAYADDSSDQFLRAVLKTPLIGDLSLDLGRLLFGKRVLKKELARAFYPDSVPDAYLKYAASQWLHHDQLRSYFEDEFSLNKELEQISKHYPDIRIPVVVVTGDHDKVVSAKLNAYRLQRSIATVKLIELKNTGHQVPQTHPESIYGALTFISNDEPGK